MKNKIISFLIVCSAALAMNVFADSVRAQTIAPTIAPKEGEERVDLMASVEFPVAELGNCKSVEECRTYCDVVENKEACLFFAENNNLMSSEQVTMARTFISLGMTGPGGCKGKIECAEYCDDVANLEECTAFGRENNLMTPQQLEESEKVMTALKSGTKPPACDSREECDYFCAMPEHMEECIQFGADAGILPPEEEGNARKVLTTIQNGVVPPCYGKECETTCHIHSGYLPECAAFAQAAGITSPSEMAIIQRILTAIEEGMTIPECDSEEECKDYCSQPAHMGDCIKFAETAGIISAEAALKARQTEGKGPGGCTSKEECDAFCEDPAHSETCFNFAKENGLISDQDLKDMEKNQRTMQASLNNMPEEVSSCLNASIGMETVEKLRNGSMVPGPEVGDQMKNCFSLAAPPEMGTAPGGKEGQPTQPPTAPTQPTAPPAQPEKPSGVENPTKCSQDCEGVGNNC
ncbi:hypothetical protein JW752_02630, partial [Candidatus Peregrinibacteria bacterium]|nr:hypothetical protein [Candidatus Peregrinibacteria bacterium]